MFATPPLTSKAAPAVIRIEGDVLKGTVRTNCLGFYQLEAGREVNGRPVWRHAAGSDLYITFDTEFRNWKVQPEEQIEERLQIKENGPQFQHVQNFRKALIAETSVPEHTAKLVKIFTNGDG